MPQMIDHSCPASLVVYTPFHSQKEGPHKVLIIPGSNSKDIEGHSHPSWLSGSKVTPQQQKNLSDVLDAAGDPMIQAQRLVSARTTIN